MLSKPSRVRMTVEGDVFKLVMLANLSVAEFALLNMLIMSSESAWSFPASGWKAMKVDHFGRGIVDVVYFVC